jgi:hypothetical protein
MPEIIAGRKYGNAVFYNSLRLNAINVDFLQLSATSIATPIELHKVVVCCVSLHFVARQRRAFLWQQGRRRVWYAA